MTLVAYEKKKTLYRSKTLYEKFYVHSVTIKVMCLRKKLTNYYDNGQTQLKISEDSAESFSPKLNNSVENDLVQFVKTVKYMCFNQIFTSLSFVTS